MGFESNSLVQSNERSHALSSPSYTCLNTSDRLSLRRINDGYFDCLYGDDERNSVYAMTEPFRYRCQTVSSPIQYVSVQQLGNGINECIDGSDEISRELSWSYFKCDVNDQYTCWVFQGDGVIEDRIRDVRLPFHRYCDSIWDIMDGRDEQNCSEWICAHGMYQCNRTGQCINGTNFCDGEFDCNDGEDELNCPKRPQRWFLEFKCDNLSEHFCITPQYLQNHTFNHPCIHYTKAGDGQIDCVGGRDERNVFSCSDHLMLGDRFICDNQTKCLNYTCICNGIDDCLDRTDELICSWNRQQCVVGQFACQDEKKCTHTRCNGNSNCSNKSNWFWCPNSTISATIYRLSKYRRKSNYETFCYSYSTDPLMPTASKISLPLLDNRATMKPRPYGFCSRGFYLTTGNGTSRICFCPPSFYGDRCQYDRRRITVRVRFDRRHRSDLSQIINVLVLLMYNNSLIIDHQNFIDIDQDFPPKHNAYLLYPRSRLQGVYSVRLEAYHSMNLLAAWEYPISPLDFLPALRLAKILHFPDGILPWLCLYNKCLNNGTCYNANNGQHLCLCQRGWQGIFCEKGIDQIQCAPHSLARNRHVCVCPHEYLQPYCFVRNTVCDNPHLCSSNEACYPLSTQPPYRFKCICNGSNCDAQMPAMYIYRQDPNELPFLIQLLKMSSDYPLVRQQILVRALTNFPITTVVKTYYVNGKLRFIPEIGLLFTFQPRLRSVDIAFHLLYVNCTDPFRNYTVDLDIQPQRCRSLDETESRSVKNFHSFCRQPITDSCFFSTSYVCYCSSKTPNRSECISYHQRISACAHCLNRGYCIQGDLQNKSNFVCVCPKCASGKLCQFTSSRFLISLEFLIEKTDWGFHHFIGPTIFLFLGIVFNGLSIVTFTQRKARKTGTGVYLLINAVTCQLVLIFLLTRVAYLHIARRYTIEERTSIAFCKGLPFLMSFLNYVSLWLMAFVTVERALAVTLLVRFVSLRTAKFACFLTTLMSLLVLGSLYDRIGQYKLASHPEDLYSWCIQEIELNRVQFIQFTTLAHEITPFLVNLVAGLTVIVFISRSKATSHHLSQRITLAKGIYQRIDLLLGPIICCITQLPQLIILFLDACDYEQTSWFAHLTLTSYYVSFMPQISLFIMYILPSPLYKELLFAGTMVGKSVAPLMRRLSVI